MARETIATRMVRRKFVLEKHLQGLSQWSIANILGCNQSVISRDITIIKKELISSTLATCEEHRSIQLAKFGVIERAAWEDYEKSKGDDGKGIGDPKFLQVIGNAVAKSMELMGTRIPVLEKSEVLQIGPSLNESARAAKISGLLDAARARAGGDASAAAPDEEVVEGELVH